MSQRRLSCLGHYWILSVGTGVWVPPYSTQSLLPHSSLLPLLRPHWGALVRVVRRAGRLTRDTGHHLMAEDTALLVQCLSYSSYFHPYSFYLILSSTSLLMFINVFTSEGIQQFKKLHNHLAKQLLKEEFWAIKCKIQFPGI